MKKTIYIAFAAFALLSFASCQKENDISVNPESEMRTVTVAFDSNPTKTTPSVGRDKTTPLWAVGDSIRILDASATDEEITHYEIIKLTADMISSDKTVALIPTILKGTTLYAVYPASATAMEYCDGEVIFKIPAEQDGSFAKANICVAKADNGNLILSNVTAVMEFTQTAATTAVKRVQVRAANPISGMLKATFGEDNKVNGVSLTTPGAHTIVATTASAQGTVYVAVAPVETGAIEFKYNKGIEAYPNNVAVYADNAGRVLERNKIYRGSKLSMDGKEYGIDYVEISANYNGSSPTPLKWAVENLAISTSGKRAWKGAGDKSLWHVVGDYFQWGAHKDYVAEANSDKGLLIYESFNNKGCVDSSEDGFVFKSAGNGKDYWFSILNSNDGAYNFISPYLPVEGSLEENVECAEYSQYNSTPATLSSSDDVASIIYGGNWRMPKNEDFEALIDATYWAWDNDDLGYYVFSPTSSYPAGSKNYTGIPSGLFKTDALLFFPAAGYGYEDELCDVGLYGDYWSSTLGSIELIDETAGKTYIQSACGLDISPEYPYGQEVHETNGIPYGINNTDALSRYNAYSVRPVRDITANKPNPTETEPEETVL